VIKLHQYIEFDNDEFEYNDVDLRMIIRS